MEKVMGGDSAFGGSEVVVVELQEAGDAGFKFVGITVSKTAFGGKEVLSILRKAFAE